MSKQILWLIPLAIIASFSGSAFADQAMSMYSVRLLTRSSGAVEGYLILPGTPSPLNSAEEILQAIRKEQYALSIYPSIEVTAPMTQPFTNPNPRAKRRKKEGMRLWVAPKEAESISPSDVKSVVLLKWPLNAAGFGDPPAIVSEEQVKLLQKTPLAFCQSKIWDCDFWASYNPEVDSAALSTMCDRTIDTRPTDDEQKAILNKGKVIHMTMACD